MMKAQTQGIKLSKYLLCYVIPANVKYDIFNYLNLGERFHKTFVEEHLLSTLKIPSLDQIPTAGVLEQGRTGVS